jgi:hypothetical protein
MEEMDTLMKLPEFETMQEAKDYLRTNLQKGANCPCCGQYVKLYKRKLNSGMAYALVKIYRFQYDNWFHINDLLEKKIALAQLEMPRLQYWRLVERKDNEDDPTKKHSGVWRLTDRGIAFVEGMIYVKKHVYVFNSKCYGFSEEETTIQEALGDKFDYEELMKS